MTGDQQDNINYIMQTSYNSLMLDFNVTVQEFIVFTEEDDIIEIKQGTGERSKFIDKMIEYFESIEEFEKCQNLLELKETIINSGD
jgi:hypothetical protein